MSAQVPPIYYIILTLATAIGVLLQAFILLAIFFAVKRTARKLREATEGIKQQALPTIVIARDLLDDVSPKLKIASANLVEASHALRHQASHVSETVDDLLDKTSVQAARVDEILTAGLDSAANATKAVHKAAAAPVRWFSALFAGLKAGVDVMRRKEAEPGTAGDDFGE
ncbi:MAG TPA: hypothetical protein VHT28_06010 [Silvibacterium sp.]|nr:hypothetical protein [Silvibacterium sp.]